MMAIPVFPAAPNAVLARMVYEQALQNVERVRAAMEQQPLFAPYARYLRARLAGPKSPWESALDEFLRDALAWDEERQRAFLSALLEQLDRLEEPERWRFVGQSDLRVMPARMQQEFLVPCARAWQLAEPARTEPRRLIGIHVRAQELEEGEQDRALRAALDANPGDVIGAIVFARRIMDGVWRAMRGLPESYEGDAEADLARLGEARSFVDELEHAKARLAMQADLDFYSQVLRDWLDFQSQASDDFAQWCRELGRDYPWVRHGFRRI